jgi:hypothetical protein
MVSSLFPPMKNTLPLDKPLIGRANLRCLRLFFGVIVALLIATAMSQAETFNDATGDSYTNDPVLDITGTTVSMVGEDIRIQIHLAGNPTIQTHGKYMVAIQGAGGSTGSNPWLRPISINGGMKYWIGSWVDWGGGVQLWKYNGATWEQINTNSPTLSANSVMLQIPASEIGATAGTNLKFDVFTSIGGEGSADGAADALSQSTQTITAWTQSFTSNPLQYSIPLPAPIPISPGTDASPGPVLTNLNTLFKWTPVPGSTGYGLYIRDVAADVLVYDDDYLSPEWTEVQIHTGVLAPGRLYRWNIRAKNAHGWSDFSQRFYYATASTTFNAPGPLEVQYFSDRTEMGWTDNTIDENGFEVERSLNGTYWSLVNTVAARTGQGGDVYWQDDNVNPRTTYHYRIRTYRNTSYSDYSNTVFATTPAGKPGPFTLTASTPVWDSSIPGAKVTLNWTASVDAGGYTLYRDGEIVPGGGGTQSPFTDTSGLTDGSVHTYFVRASNADGTRDSNTVTVTMPSPSVFNVNGVIRDTSGFPVGGAQVQLKRYNTIFWQGYTVADGSIPSVSVPSGNFSLVVIKSGYTSLFQSVAGDSGDSLFLNLTLQATGTPPAVANVIRTPEPTAIRPEDPAPVPGIRAANFRVYANGAFSANGVLYPDRMMIILSHGWRSSLSAWATDMAAKITSKHTLGTQPNIVGWDWSGKAATWYPQTDEAAKQGENLGKALVLELGTSYHQRLHFIGHSLGTIVNSRACDFLHGKLPRQAVTYWDENNTRPHVTLLDQAELANTFGSNVSTSAASAWFDSQSRSQLFDIVNGTATADSGYKSPFPESATWTDNYITLVGLHGARAVNVFLPAGVATPWGAHADSHQWYRQSIQNVSATHAMGFARAYERALVFPPTGNGMSAGSVWTWPSQPTSAFDLVRIENPALFSTAGTVMRAASVVAGNAGSSVADGYVTGIRMVGGLLNSAIQKTGQVVTQTGEKIGNLWDAALDAGGQIDPDATISNNIVIPSWKLILTTAVPAPVPQGGSGIHYAPPPTTPPQAWVPVRVPADAAFLAFDFTVTGDPGDDQIVCAVNEQNLFTLPARFAPDGSPVSTDFLDVSAYSGQEVELYFGLVGGTSSGSTLSIDGLRFVTVPLPALEAAVTGNQVRLTWPAAASGWVPQRNATLDPGTWEDVSLDGSAVTEEGTVVLDRPKTLEREFFRLRRE